MKKIVILIVFCLLSVVGFGQEVESHYYFGVKATVATNFISSLDYTNPFNCLAAVGTVYLKGDIPFDDLWYLVPEGSLGFGVVGEEMYAKIFLGIGIKFQITNNWYCGLMVYPRMKICGVGHQVYGDYATGWITFAPTVGYRAKIGPNSQLFAEVLVPVDLTVIRQLPYYKNNGGISLSFGYSYFIN